MRSTGASSGVVAGAVVPDLVLGQAQDEVLRGEVLNPLSRPHGELVEPRGRCARASARHKPLGLKVRVRGNNRPQPLLRRLVPAVRIGMVDLHEPLVRLLDLDRVGLAVDA